MLNQESTNMWPVVNVNNQSSEPEMMQSNPRTSAQTAEERPMTYRSIYPEIYYKLMPYVSMTCDVIFSYSTMPTQQRLEEMSDAIHDDFCAMYPDMADYMGKFQETATPPGDIPTFNGRFRGDGGFVDGFRPGFDRFRRRGLGRDLIYALLLSELLSRGGFIY